MRKNMTITILIIITAVASIAFAAALVGGIMLLLKSNGAYKIGIEQAATNKSIVDLIGNPIKPAFFVGGSVLGGGAFVAVRVTLLGSRAKGRLLIQAEYNGANYEFSQLKFFCNGKTVDLLNETAILQTEEFRGKVLLSSRQRKF
jgi:hypothetical protein